jgi:hypothetical protein
MAQHPTAATVDANANADPRRNPSYPQRVHVRERPQWQALLKSWQDRVAAARAQRAAKGDRADLLLARMEGALDQIAEAVRRLPMEVGPMYEEDRHRVDEAVAALERLFKQWEG